MTLTPFDDYPLHQTPLPVAQPATGDKNHYDRYFFNGFDPGGDWYFGVAMGVYPNRNVIDAAFSLVHEGVQRSVFASGLAPLDRGVTRVGPITVEVVEPLRTLRVRVDAAHHGITADLLWNARTPVLEEPRMTIGDGPALIIDATRLVQWGTWQGTIESDGGRIAADPATARGVRDRSWGVRPVGEPQGGRPNSLAAGLFMTWAPVHFTNECTHAIILETPAAGRVYASACAVPVRDDDLYGNDAGFRHASARYDLSLKSGTRFMSGATFRYAWAESDEETLVFEPLLRFQMKGIGYLHPSWGHGVWQGDGAEHAEVWKTDEVNPTDPTNFHVQNFCRVTRGDETGFGVLEQLMLGPHAPTGLTGYVDVAP